MKLKEVKPLFLIRKPEELSLSGPAFTKLLKAILSKGAAFRFQAKGFSMLPFIKDNDVITISALLNSSIGFGKPVAFIHCQTGKLVIHRVVGKSRNHYLIKGDSASQSDSLTPRENILGVVSKVERNGKNVFFGLGPERFLIALLSRRFLFFTFLLFVWRILRPFMRALKKSKRNRAL